jgi:hypothetical protein
MRRKRPLGWIQKIRARPGISVRSLGHRVSMVLLGLLLAMGAVGCASLERLPAVKLAQAPNADILNISDVRFYTTDTARRFLVVETTALSAPVFWLAGASEAIDRTSEW